ncbi:putative clathrin assembly protein [Heracleum sosnowskyi]|uniref:Clathrin assembly protein n=1 Tax=Heracleum sosnowskyi TaxID=360622 RepID=A0AAD8ISB9_9APIA|nr:putative clathrin assembly protein [Heracleum sosnowskyi]
MELSNRASGMFKDKYSLWLATLRTKTGLRNPEIEAAVIKATNHDEFYIDCKNSERIFAWVRFSPSHVKPFVRAITVRMEKTRSWVVALKGLILMHGIFSCKVPAVEHIGRLPFDFSNFKDRNSHNEVLWGYDDFIRAYYLFLDQKSYFIFLLAQEKRKSTKLPKIGDDRKPNKSSNSVSLMQDLLSLKIMQSLLDLLLKTRPETYSMDSHTKLSPLILQAMDSIVIEVFNMYKGICKATPMLLDRTYKSAGTAEVTLALKIMRIARSQREQLSSYFKFCKRMGVLNAEDCPTLKPSPEEDIEKLENILATGGLDIFNPDQKIWKSLVIADPIKSQDSDKENHKALVVAETKNVHEEDNTRRNLKTVITNEWQVFDDDYSPTSPFLSPSRPFFALDAPPARNAAEDLPDLISFE